MKSRLLLYKRAKASNLAVLFCVFANSLALQKSHPKSGTLWVLNAIQALYKQEIWISGIFYICFILQIFISVFLPLEMQHEKNILLVEMSVCADSD